MTLILVAACVGLGSGAIGSILTMHFIFKD